jgi:hypothetical protein
LEGLAQLSQKEKRKKKEKGFVRNRHGIKIFTSKILVGSQSYWLPQM